MIKQISMAAFFKIVKRHGHSPYVWVNGAFGKVHELLEFTWTNF